MITSKGYYLHLMSLFTNAVHFQEIRTHSPLNIQKQIFSVVFYAFAYKTSVQENDKDV